MDLYHYRVEAESTLDSYRKLGYPDIHNVISDSPETAEEYIIKKTGMKVLKVHRIGFVDLALKNNNDKKGNRK